MSTEYSVREPGGSDLYTTDDRDEALRYRQAEVAAKRLSPESLVVDDEGSIYEIWWFGVPTLQKDGRAIAEWIDGKAVGEARV